MPPRRFLDRLRRRGSRRRGQRVALEVGPDLDDRDAQRVRDVITHLLQRHDTTTQQADLVAIADAYSALADRGRVRFFSMLARDLWTDPVTVDHAIAARNASTDDPARRATERALRLALIPPAARLLQLFTGIDDGVKFLIDLRADELRLASDPAINADDATALADLDHELKSQLTMLFDVGLLELRRITWEAPAALLEKLIEYEAVHAIGSWADLKNRLDSDRRCHAFFHPAMPNEPLVFVEIALTNGIASELSPLLDAHAPDLDPDHADTAIFYSISNCQPGLTGVNLGTALIKQVVEELRHDLPRLARFATLSPIPGYRAWLETALHEGDLRAHERELLPAAPERVLARLAHADWDADEAIRPALVALCARYLTTTEDGRAIDPVANFHLANGAVIERINWLADPSPLAREQSATLMANYTYEPDRIATRAEAYIARGEVPTSAAVKELLGKTGHQVRRMEKLIYLVWDRPSRAGSDVRAQLLDEIAPKLLACSPRGLQMDLDDDTADVKSMVAIPGDELPVRALVSIWVDAHDTRAQYEEVLAAVGIRRAGYLVTESLYRDYGDNEHAAPRDWPDGRRSPGIVTLTVFDKPVGVTDETFYGHWYGHQSPMSEWIQLRARYVRNAVVRPVTPGAPQYRAIVEEAWPSVEHVTDLQAFFGAADPSDLGERIRIMLDSTKLLYNPDTMRNYTLAEYLLKTP